jgi:hypothetical protein
MDVDTCLAKEGRGCGVSRPEREHLRDYLTTSPVGDPGGVLPVTSSMREISFQFVTNRFHMNAVIRLRLCD